MVQCLLSSVHHISRFLPYLSMYVCMRVNGLQVMDWQIVAKLYIRTLRFWLDVLSVVPFVYLVSATWAWVAGKRVMSWVAKLKAFLRGADVSHDAGRSFTTILLVIVTLVLWQSVETTQWSWCVTGKSIANKARLLTIHFLARTNWHGSECIHTRAWIFKACSRQMLW